MKKLFSFSIAILCVALGAYIIVQISDKTPAGYERVDNYVDVSGSGVTCLALTPECGYCPGVVIDKACYVKKPE